MSISPVDHQQTKENDFGITSISDTIEPKRCNTQQQQQLYQHRKHLHQQQSTQRQCDSNGMSEWVVPKAKSLDPAHHKFRMIVCGDSGSDDALNMI